MSLKSLDQIEKILADAQIEYDAEKKRLTDELEALKERGRKHGLELPPVTISKGNNSKSKKSTGNAPIPSTLDGAELKKINTQVSTYLHGKEPIGISKIVEDTKLKKEDISASFKIEGNKIQKAGGGRGTKYFVK